MRRPPPGVVMVARSHWLVGAVIFFSIGLLYFFTRGWPVEIAPEAYRITFGLGALYATGGTLVWFGLPAGRLLSRVCGLLYLARPNFGSFLWNVMDSPEYRAHFQRSHASPMPKEVADDSTTPPTDRAPPK